MHGNERCEKDTPGPFRLEGLLPGTGHPWIDRRLQALAERLSGLSALDETYRRLEPSHDCDQFIARVCGALDIEANVHEHELAHTPRTGPVVVVANHPFGAVEGLLLARLLRAIRGDVRVLANFMIRRIPELDEIMIGVDPFEERRTDNGRGLRQAMRWLRDGGLLLTFPAGAVAHWHWRHASVVDPPWHPGVGRLVQSTRASVTPVYVHGHNSLFFHLAGFVHPRLRTALLARELLNKSRSRILMRIGRTLPPQETRDADPASLIHLLRIRTYALAMPTAESAARPATASVPRGGRARAQYSREVAALPPAQRLAAVGDLAAYVAGAEQIPALLEEIGLQREMSFRAVGEGTGRCIDLDRFDRDYLQLFLWDDSRQQLAGGYRIGLTDRILAARGRCGLYTHTLFSMRMQLFRHIGPAIELGRSFVCAEYQRSFAPLLLLWKGIGAFVCGNPRYRVLFGPVSISSDYMPVSRQIMVDYLRSKLLARDLSRFVKARAAPPRSQVLWRSRELATLGDIDVISKLLAGIESDGKGMPVLLRQYLRLGGRVLGFNVDSRFNDAIDALIMIDLTRCGLRTLQRYMGEREAVEYLSRHASGERAA